MSKLPRALAASALAIGLGGGMLAVSAPAVQAAQHNRYALAGSKAKCTAQLAGIIATNMVRKDIRDLHIASKCAKKNPSSGSYQGKVRWYDR